MDTGIPATRGLAAGAVGTVRVIAFGTSIVAPAASVVTVLALALGLPLTAAYGGVLMNVLPFVALGWLLIGVVAVALIRPATPAAWTG